MLSHDRHASIKLYAGLHSSGFDYRVRLSRRSGDVDGTAAVLLGDGAERLARYLASQELGLHRVENGLGDPRRLEGEVQAVVVVILLGDLLPASQVSQLCGQVLAIEIVGVWEVGTLSKRIRTANSAGNGGDGHVGIETRILSLLI